MSGQYEYVNLDQSRKGLIKTAKARIYSLFRYYTGRLDGLEFKASEQEMDTIARRLIEDGEAYLEATGKGMFTKFNCYQQAVNKTALPQADLTYSILGLTNEAGEVAGKYKKVLRGDKELSKAEMAAELGDVLWYIARCATLLELSLSEIAERNIYKLADRQRRDRLRGEGDTR